MENLDGLSSLTQIDGYLYIRNNSLLTDISGLQNIDPATISGSIGLYIRYNANLSVCNLPNFCTYLAGSGARTISGNKTTCLDVAAVTNACATACPSGDITFTTQQQIDDFGAMHGYCTDITLANLAIGYTLGNSTTNITDLTPLQGISEVTGNLSIRNNPDLNTVSGLNNLKSIGGYFSVQNNSSLI